MVNGGNHKRLSGGVIVVDAIPKATVQILKRPDDEVKEVTSSVARLERRATIIYQHIRKKAGQSGWERRT